MKGSDNVKLENKILGVQTFEKSHAERILGIDVRLQKTNWELVDKKLEFKDGKIIARKSSGTDKSSAESGQDSSGD